MQLNPLPSHSFPLSFEVPFPFPSKPPKEKKNPFLPPGPFVVVPLIVKSSRFPPLPVLPPNTLSHPRPFRSCAAFSPHTPFCRTKGTPET